MLYFLSWESEWTCCIRGKVLQISLRSTLTLCFKLLHKNSLKIDYLACAWNLGFSDLERQRPLQWGNPSFLQGGVWGQKTHWQSAYLSLWWQLEPHGQLKLCSWFLSSWSYMKQILYICNLTECHEQTI